MEKEKKDQCHRACHRQPDKNFRTMILRESLMDTELNKGE